MTAYLGTSPFWFPHYAFAKDNAMAIAGLTKSFSRIHKLNRIMKGRKRTFIVVCPDCLTEFIIKDLDVEIVCPICNELEIED